MTVDQSILEQAEADYLAGKYERAVFYGRRESSKGGCASAFSGERSLITR